MQDSWIFLWRGFLFFIRLMFFGAHISTPLAKPSYSLTKTNDTKLLQFGTKIEMERSLFRREQKLKTWITFRHLRFGSYPVIPTNNRTFLTNTYVNHDDSIIVTAATIYESKNVTIVRIDGPQSGDWFVAAYMPYWNERVQQQVQIYRHTWKRARINRFS